MKEVQLLLEKYKQGSITAAELERLQELSLQPDAVEIIKTDIDTLLQQGAPDSGWQPADHPEILTYILTQPTLKATRSWRNKWLLAAACLAALAIGTGTWFYQQQRPPAIVAQKAKPIQPGSNKAMLVLADGSTVALDSANLGQIARQGNASINNNGEGITYQTNGKASTIVYNAIVTPRGGQYQLGLPDGSRVWLNAASSIRFPTAFAGKERRVEISGEAYFQVAPNAQQPFFVTVKGNKTMDVQVLGTSFNIMAYPDEQMITTTLESGAVQLLHAGNKTQLQPGLAGSLNEAATFDVATADMEEVLAWKDGKFRFRNTNIQTIMRQIARWYDVEVSYAGDLSDVRLTGVISRRADADDLLQILSATQRVNFETTNNQIKVKPFHQEQ
ncbi:FecR family protein [Chitinophaga jiangningensis]|uniref:FecR family protein n=1 Tax=Chitinophaga jiangningensis TaxID=1419482 RepID=A0A1M7N3J2_9BACT|nr:FecR domain-containing protein [Chitinophaga jiangningensis]SHM97550.1 FecR family protein [Chitinophaga jiangningensis]